MQEGCQAALTAGWSLLEAGGSALDACEAAVRVMEDDPLFNAGTGSVLNAAGEVELDAALMDGATLAYGSVANIRTIRNPITLARHVLLGPATMLAGSGAEQFALKLGLPHCENHELVLPHQQTLWQRHRERLMEQAQATPPLTDPEQGVPHHQQTEDAPPTQDTVGALALDQHGSLIAAGSTGGMRFKLPGRVGDTPMIGGGIYADAAAGACVCTGWGEAIARFSLARRAVELLEHGHSPQKAAESVIALLARRIAAGRAGCIILDPHGRVGLSWSTDRMAYAYRVA